MEVDLFKAWIVEFPGHPFSLLSKVAPERFDLCHEHLLAFPWKATDHANQLIGEFELSWCAMFLRLHSYHFSLEVYISPF